MANRGYSPYLAWLLPDGKQLIQAGESYDITDQYNEILDDLIERSTPVEGHWLYWYNMWLERDVGDEEQKDKG